MAPYSKMTDSNYCYVKQCTKRLTFMEKHTCACSKCTNHYCTLHRLAETHDCPHDFTKDVNIGKFIEENKCVRDKMIKI
jgi:predicted nucleic acid binding AN1-type Zn finger protein